ncbi:MAG: MASE3 domain-containing sensor histidine kinase [Bacillota bacterium]
MEVIREKNKVTYEAVNVSIMKSAVVLSVICFILTLVGLNNFLLFHTLTEMFCLFIGLGVAIIAYYSNNITMNGRFLYVGIATFFLSIFQLLHVLTFEGVKIFHWNNINTAVQISVVFKYIESLTILSILIIPVSLLKERKNLRVITAIYSIVSALIILAVLYLGVFPDCLDSFSSPTMFKKVSEYIISGIFITVLFLLIKSKSKIPENIYQILLGFLGLKIIAQLLFTFYNEVDDVINIFAHLIRFISFYAVYKVIVETNFRRPVRRLFHMLDSTNSELRQKSIDLQIANRQLKKEIADCIRIEDLLRKSEERYRLLLEFIPDAIFVHSEKGILFSNQAGIRLLGADSLEQLMECPPYELLHHSQRETLDKRFEEIKKTDKKPYIFEECLIRKDGTSVETEVITISYPCEEESAYLSVVRDITQRKQVEVLKKSVDENTRLLKEAVELDKIKTDFFTDISHELRTPLSIMLCTLQIIESGIRGNSAVLEDREKLSKYVSSLKQNSLKLLKTVNNLLDITKIDSGNFDLKLINCDIVELVERITLSVFEYTKDRGLCLMFDSEVEERIIECDIDKIERIVLNLLSNAIKFTKRGGRIEVNILDKKGSIVLAIKDTGIGIPEDKLDVIFERFKQVKNTLARDHDSTGIGLSLVKSLVEIHGGTISVESKVGVGTTFYIELPMKILPKGGVEAMEAVSEFERSHVDKLNIELSDLL